jgi:DNA-binding CsgD family transcriptional regulator
MLQTIAPDSLEFMHHRAWGTHTLAVLARELYIPEAIPQIERQLLGPWTDDFQPNLFQTLKALGWTKALQGDHFNAFRHLRQADEIAPSDAWRVVAACDRAYLARCFKEMRWSRQELDVAESLAAKIDWRSTNGEECVGLLLLAELFSAVDTAKAAMYLAQYRELGDIKSPLHRRRDPRIVALENYSTGMTEIALGNTKRGLSELQEAFTVFEAFGYQWRAAQCLLAEYKVTRTAKLLDQATERLRNYRQSWLAEGLALADESPEQAAKLPPMREKVLQEICKGKTTEQIATDLGKSKFTVMNHTQLLFKQFGVNNRTSLAAEALRLGYFKPT